jgi:hypothetical protein
MTYHILNHPGARISERRFWYQWQAKPSSDLQKNDRQNDIVPFFFPRLQYKYCQKNSIGFILSASLGCGWINGKRACTGKIIWPQAPPLAT